MTQPCPDRLSVSNSWSGGDRERHKVPAVHVVGGATLVVSLLNEDLIDELRLMVHPVASRLET